ncbi:trypsin-like serine protease [Kitasatospora sp. NPDC006697]|uniref:trypsin-like serine protease n=1 Tax=Kitasatospora sp. NPDC006697 TaxID=3364020 RepID=UPI0036AF9845
MAAAGSSATPKPPTLRSSMASGSSHRGGEPLSGSVPWPEIAIVEGGSQGTGRLLGARLVLTAAHLLGDGRVRATVPRGLGTRTCQVLWNGADERCDAALLLADSDLVGAEPGAVQWGEPGDTDPWPGCVVLGFPRPQRSGRQPDTEQFVGTLKPGSSIVRGRYVIDGDHSAPQPVAGGSPWQGMSGAPATLRGHVIGVVTQDPAGWGHSRLEAVRARTLLENGEFCNLVHQHTGRRPVLRVLARAAGGEEGTDRAGGFRWDRVSDLSATDFEVHPVRREAGFPRMVEYVPRSFEGDLEVCLTEASKGGGFVLLTGPSAAGKTRSGFEAVRRTLPDRLLCRPSGAADLRALVDAHLPDAKHLVWLDDLERHLHNAGLTPELLAHLQRRGTVVVATLRSQLYAELLEQDGVTGSFGESLYGPRAAGRVLRQARHVPVPRRWFGSERDRASKVDDPRIIEALAAGEQYGLAEYLAAGPQLAKLWEAGASHRPRGAALVATAVDLARTGLTGPLPIDAIEELHTDYLRRMGGAVLRPEPLTEAWKWASSEFLGVTSLLVPSEGGGWRPFDYLVTEVSRVQGRSDVLGDAVWRKALDLAEGRNRSLLALSALTADRPDIAAAALRLPAESGEVEAMVGLAAVLIESGDREKGELWLRKAARQEDGTAMLSLGSFLVFHGNREEGEKWLERAVEAGRAQGLRLLGDLAAQDGEDKTAAELWRRGAERGDDECAVKYGNLLRQQYLTVDNRGAWLKESADRGLSAAALAFAGWLAYRKQKDAAAYYLVRAREGALAAAEDGNPDAMITLGTVLAWEGDPESAESWFRKARQRTPLLMPDWRLVRAEADRGGLQVMAVSKTTEERLAPGQLSDVMQGLWPLDCQYCGLSLGRGVPALRVFEQPWGATASLYHLGMCHYPEWTDNDGTRRDSSLGIFKIIGPSEPRLTWTASAARTPQVVLDDKNPVIMMVNAGIESVELAQRDDGQWRMAPSYIHQQQGMVPADSALNTVRGVATVLRGKLTVRLGVEEWSSRVSRDMKRLIKRQGGVLLFITSGLPPVKPNEAVLNLALSAPDVVAGWVPVLQNERGWRRWRSGLG